MRIVKQHILPRIEVPGAVARQKTDFGSATGYGTISDNLKQRTGA